MRLRWMFGLIFVLALALALTACGGGDEKEENGDGAGTPAATKTVEAEKTQKPAETSEPEKTPKKTPEPSGGGGASLSDVPVYPGADKTGGYSGDYSLPSLVGDVGDEEFTDVEWGLYETGDSVGDVADFYKDKMPDNGWKDEGWFDLTLGTEASWGSFTRDDGDSAAWIVVTRNEDDDKTEIVIGAGSR